jgi:hypothetical protein
LVERNSFDEMVKRFGVGASRRQLLGGLIGSAAAALAGVALGGDEAIAAKKGPKSKKTKSDNGKQKGVGKGNGIGQGNGGGNTGGNGHGNGGSGPSKLSFCHKNEVTSEYEFITVAKTAEKSHLNHGDVPCGDPSSIPACKVGTCDETGACGTANAEDSIACGIAGTCQGGECVEPTP